MAKKTGAVSAIYMQTSAASQSATATAMARVGTTLWYMVTSATKAFWDKSKAIVIYDAAAPVVPLEIDYAVGAVRLSAAAGGAVTADHYYFACAQVGGFRSHSIDEVMALVECGCYEDTGEVYEPTVYGCSGSADGFFTTVDSTLSTAKTGNKDLTFTSKLLGAAGDGISIECVVAGNNTPLSISVATLAITINSATGPAGAATSLAREILDALEASADAMALIKVNLKTGSDGSGIFGAYSHTHLAGGVTISTGVNASLETSNGGNADLKFLARSVGIAGNSTTVAILVPAGENALGVVVAGSDITVTAHTVAGVSHCTAIEIMNALNAYPAAFALIETALKAGQNGTGNIVALTKTNLAGGAADTDPDRWGEDIIGVFYWDSGASLIRTSGLITLEKVNIKTAKKDLVGKTINFKSQGFMYEHSG